MCPACSLFIRIFQQIASIRKKSDTMQKTVMAARAVAPGTVAAIGGVKIILG